MVHFGQSLQLLFICLTQEANCASPREGVSQQECNCADTSQICALLPSCCLTPSWESAASQDHVSQLKSELQYSCLVVALHCVHLSC